MKLIVIGGGAAGFFCAVNAARMNRKLHVTIMEKTGKLLSKVRISGGGRCNVTHACFSIPEMTTMYPRGANFVKKTFHQFFTSNTIEWFEQRGVKLKTENDGRMFPVTDSSQSVIDCLLHEAERYGVDIKMNAEVKHISRVDSRWDVELANGEVHSGDFICVASGGYPKDAMFEWIKKTGHTVEAPVPSLFTFNMPGNDITKLTGISSTAKVKVKGTRLETQGAVLVTHWGLSGPAILRLSSVAARDLHDLNYKFSVLINWCHENEQQVKLRMQEMRVQHPAQKVYNGNCYRLPQRLWEYLCGVSGLDGNVRWSDVPGSGMNLLARNLTNQEIPVEGKTTFKEEFVTAGGVILKEIDPQTMESRILPGLYFAGEIMNVDGVTGGFNFQHAWTSGWIAANSVASKV